MPRPLTALAIAAAMLATSPAHAVDVFTRETFEPYTVNDVNAIIGNHYFVQSMLAFDATPFTFGLSSYQTRADWARTDGSIYKGSLDRHKALMSFGFGKPTSGTAAFAVFNIDGINSGPWPSYWQNAVEEGHIRAASFGLVAAAGLAHRGWVGQLALFYHETEMDVDALGRFTICDDGLSCTEPYVRSGSPEPLFGRTEKTTVTNTMLTLENSHGYSTGILLSPKEVEAPDGSTERKTGLASLRALAEPYDLLPQGLGLLGFGLTTFGQGLDYYGDQSAAIQDAVAAGESAPAPVSKGIVEFPFSFQRIADTGATARIVLQASPAPAFRLAEAGYFYEGDPTWSFLPQVGGRAKLFKRASSYVPSVDAYAGFFWVFKKNADEPNGRGLSAYATYSYNSPDAANLVPLANAHILGLQAVFGNPTAMPPPSSLIKYPGMDE